MALMTTMATAPALHFLLPSPRPAVADEAEAPPVSREPAAA
jgi:hypothetical protein